ncbi:hypothetical protein RMSM_02292 [Rhodopirellula maiorica SM1]|uniref:DUF6916 domain-containing protein n=1 Tax=Rhodopirellula maiorica SM1 TaxID=1265738 RepID=M5S3N2_9BACT|nr:hypothetical protein [Rhodopirellula maiorica]EMI20779.1 hypothetical protein RMSM_02292 [Rhodopirellula maiorica SM1]
MDIEKQGQFKLDDFTAHVGTEFMIHSASGQVVVELIEAKPFAVPGQFSLLFHDRNASVQSCLPQSLYTFTHEQLYEQMYFIVPVGPDSTGKGILYEAVFS